MKKTLTIEGSGHYIVGRKPSAGASDWSVFDQSFDTQEEAEEFIKTQNPIGFDYVVISLHNMIPHARYDGPGGKA